jgi:hypothetical protein
MTHKKVCNRCRILRGADEFRRGNICKRCDTAYDWLRKRGMPFPCILELIYKHPNTHPKDVLRIGDGVSRANCRDLFCASDAHHDRRHVLSEAADYHSIWREAVRG